jgi:TonB family protein
MQELHEYSNELMAPASDGIERLRGRRGSHIACSSDADRFWYSIRAASNGGKRYHVEKMERSWRSYAGSSIAHVGIAGLLLALSVPVAEHARKPAATVSLIAPVLRPPVSIQPPHRRFEAKLPAPRPTSAPVTTPKVIAENPPPPAALKPAPKAVQAIPEAPKAVNLEVPQHVPPPPAAELPVAPKVPVHVGSFDQAAAPTGTNVSPTVAVGAFGDGASAQAGGGSRAAVHLGGFGDQTVQPAGAHPPRQPETNTYTAVEILFKPKPVYTTDARDSRVEGEVALEVVFLATGEIRVGRVLHGLGHGLDEAAQQAAAHVRFKPATRAGRPVDTPATIRITFELT